MQSEGDGDVQSDAKINSMRKHTASHFFGVPTGAESFYETMMSGFSKKVQPPMLVGKAKVPSDLACVLSGQNSRAGHHHKTIEHNRTSTSFVNNTSCHDYGGQLSPLEIDTGREDKMPTGRHSLIQKHAGKVSINKEKMFTPKQRSMVVSNAQSEENFMQVKRPPRNQFIRKTAQSKDYINVQSNEQMSANGDYSAIQANKLNIRHKNVARNRLTTFTTGSMSDVSTTVVAPSHKQ